METASQAARNILGDKKNFSFVKKSKKTKAKAKNKTKNFYFLVPILFFSFCTIYYIFIK